MRVLVTGAAGFVGANVVRRLLADGHEVHALVRSGTDGWRLAEIAGDIRTHELDLRDRDGVAALLPAVAPQRVFHLAAHGAYSWQTSSTDILETNVVGTSNLLDACVRAGVEMLVNAGSSSEYGRKDHAPAEGEALEPISVYGVAKAAATLLCSVVSSHGLNVTTLRLYSAYGPYEEPGRLVPALVVAALRGHLPPLASPAVARDFVWVGDAVDAFVLAGGSTVAGGVYNVGSGRQTTLAEAVDATRRALGVRGEPVWSSMPNRPWDTEVWVADASRIEAELGWRASIDFHEGLSRTAAWFTRHPELHARYGVG